MPIQFCLHNRQITAEDPQGGHVIWHGAARSQRGSSVS